MLDGGSGCKLSPHEGSPLRKVLMGFGPTVTPASPSQPCKPCPAPQSPSAQSTLRSHAVPLHYHAIQRRFEVYYAGSLGLGCGDLSIEAARRVYRHRKHSERLAMWRDWHGEVAEKVVLPAWIDFAAGVQLECMEWGHSTFDIGAVDCRGSMRLLLGSLKD